MSFDDKIIAAYRARVVRADGDACWSWSGYCDSYGYALVRGRPNIKAHRVSYEIHIGPIPPGMVICHRCDNPVCTNPAHLFAGTRRDNSRDMASKLRVNTSKLTREQVLEIYHAEGLHREIAAKHGIDDSVVSGIKLGRQSTYFTGAVPQYKGRARKLTAEKVRAIRADSRSHVEVARENGVTPQLIGEIRRREKWTHVE